MIRLVAEAFDAGVALTRHPPGRSITGAVVSFLGIARGEPGPGPALELEAYPGFTEARIAALIETTIDRFGLQDAEVIHRVGPVAAGEVIVLVLTAAAHRREAFEACDFLMDYLKSRAPFWKKEYGPDGTRWVEPTARDLADIERWRETEQS
jgi:molybdopterin synthase catalytic subunit